MIGSEHEHRPKAGINMRWPASTTTSDALMMGRDDTSNICKFLPFDTADSLRRPS
jgi:hypothetical protein